MKNLEKKFRDPRSRTVLAALESEIENFDGHFRLQQMRGEQAGLYLRQFAYIAKARLDAATNFVPFLSAAEEKISEQKDWESVAHALRNNLNEELGMIDGKYNADASHDVWRQNFRAGMQRVLAEKHSLSFERIETDYSTRNIEESYGKTILAMPQKYDAPYLAGAFMALEGILEKEFAAILSYIRTHLQELTANEVLYITHHAGHEKRHLEEVAEPLLEKCARSPHVVPLVIEGIKDMSHLRTHGVLGYIAEILPYVSAGDHPGISADILRHKSRPYSRRGGS
jgi:hypothetical protein